MHRRVWTAALFYSVMLVPLLLMIIFPLDWEFRLLLGALVAAICAAMCRWTYRQTVRSFEEQRRRNRQEIEREFVRTMNHVRHNWMNELQILYGYIQLQKYDKLRPAVEKIIAKAQQESMVSRLGDTSLVAFLLHRRMRCGPLAFDVELEKEIDLRELPLAADQVGAFIRKATEAFHRHAKSGEAHENALHLHIGIRDDGLLLDFTYRGQADEAALREEIGGLLLEYAPDVSAEFQQFEALKAAVVVRAPFKADGKGVV
jgi:hypothetical protein